LTSEGRERFGRARALRGTPIRYGMASGDPAARSNPASHLVELDGTAEARRPGGDRHVADLAVEGAIEGALEVNEVVPPCCAFCDLPPQHDFRRRPVNTVLQRSVGSRQVWGWLRRRSWRTYGR
jgi:hypothetical protein